MVNLYDIARLSRSGAGFSALAGEFGLPQADVQRALEALLPAFTLAFQRVATDPAIFAEVMRAIGSGRYAPFYDGGAGPGSDHAEPLLTLLFRNPETARQVSAEAAALTGIGAQTLARMMPTLAGLLIGGMFRYASLEGISEMLGQWAEALATASRTVAAASRPAPPPPPADPWSAWLDLARAMSGPAAAPAPRVPAPAPANPFEAWTAAMAGYGQSRSAASPEPASAQPRNPFDVLSQMFETGREVQATHLAHLRSIMDTAWGSSPAR